MQEWHAMTKEIRAHKQKKRMQDKSKANTLCCGVVHLKEKQKQFSAILFSC